MTIVGTKPLTPGCGGDQVTTGYQATTIALRRRSAYRFSGLVRRKSILVWTSAYDLVMHTAPCAYIVPQIAPELCRSSRVNGAIILSLANMSFAQAYYCRSLQWVNLDQSRLGFKTCLSKTKTKTKTRQFQDQDQDSLIQDQDQDSAVSRPRQRPRLAYPRPRPRPRLKTYKTNTGSP